MQKDPKDEYNFDSSHQSYDSNNSNGVNSEYNPDDGEHLKKRTLSSSFSIKKVLATVVTGATGLSLITTGSLLPTVKSKDYHKEQFTDIIETVITTEEEPIITTTEEEPILTTTTISEIVTTTTEDNLPLKVEIELAYINILTFTVDAKDDELDYMVRIVNKEDGETITEMEYSGDNYVIIEEPETTIANILIYSMNSDEILYSEDVEISEIEKSYILPVLCEASLDPTNGTYTVVLYASDPEEIYSGFECRLYVDDPTTSSPIMNPSTMDLNEDIHGLIQFEGVGSLDGAHLEITYFDSNVDDTLIINYYILEI